MGRSTGKLTGCRVYLPLFSLVLLSCFVLNDTRHEGGWGEVAFARVKATPGCVHWILSGLRLRGGEKEPYSTTKSRHMVQLTRKNSAKDTDNQNHKLAGLKKTLQAKLKNSASARAPENGDDHKSALDEATEEGETVGPNSSGGKKVRAGSFAALGLSDEIVRGMYHAGYKFPTPIQRKLIPPVLNGSHVVAMARTGSGKTAAFLAPMIHRLAVMAEKKKSLKLRGVAGLVLLPTRELALQSFQFFKTYAKFTVLTGCLISGGEPIESQFAALATNPDIVFATPGRLLQVLDEVASLSLKQVRVCVLDEADRLFESSLATVVSELLARMRKERGLLVRRDVMEPSRASEGERQMILVSATLPPQLSEFAKTDIGDAHCVFVRLDTERLLSPTLRVAFLSLLPASKLAALLFLLKDIITVAQDQQHRQVRDDPFSILSSRGLAQASDSLSKDVSRIPREQRKRCLIFCATKYSVELLETVLRHAGVLATGVHGRMDQDQRNTALDSFKRRDVEALVVTDVAARGLDIPLLDYVINYDVPATPKLFVHRAGRAGRAGAIGTVFSLVTPVELPHTLDTALFLGRKIESEPSGSPMTGQSVLESPDNFLMGSLPMRHVTFWSDFTFHVFQRDSSLEGQSKSARRGYALYAKTCPKPSQNAVETAKAMLEQRTIAQKTHWWFREWTKESGEAQLEEQMDEARNIVLQWQPKNTSSLAMDGQQELWEMAKPFHEHAAKRQAEDHPELQPLELTDGSNPEAARRNEEVQQALSYSITQLDDDDDDEMGLRTKASRPRARQRSKQMVFGGDEEELGEQEQVRQRGLRVATGGSMGDAVKENTVNIAPDDAQGIAAARRQRPLKVWDRKKHKYVQAEHLNRQQARELKVLRNEAGERIRLKRKQSGGDEEEEGGGDLYRKWAAKAKVRVQKVGEYENKKLVKKAAEQAVVPIRNKLAGEARFGASIIAGAKRTTPAVTKLEAHKGAALSADERARLKQLRDRRGRAESQRQKLATKRTGGVGELPPKLKTAMEQRAGAMGRHSKGLRVGGKVGAEAALAAHKKMMKLGNPPKKKKQADRSRRRRR